MADLPHITVCICTFRRPALLKRLLDGIKCQETGGAFTLSIVVADNDSKESARATVDDHNRDGRVPARYVVEPKQNIALARNTALAQATGDYIAFIDDDECPEPNWLRTMLDACSKFKADGVLGPVLPFFEIAPPEWILRGKFFDRPQHRTGFVIPWTEGRTGNLLFKRNILAGVEPVFLPQFGSGGEDRNFFMRMIGKGHVFVWCDEAIAHEVVPPVRWQRRFMLKRALLRGKTSLNHQTIGFKGVLKSMAALPLYTVALPVLLLGGQHRFMNYLIKVCDHAGRILAFAGISPIRQSYVTE